MREEFLADVAALATRACQVLASTETQALDSVVKELEGVISFMRLGCPAAFTIYFEEQEWPDMEIAEMQQDWATARDLGMESRVEALTHEIVKLHREAYYTLRRSQADQVVAERAREESAARLDSERATWESERAALLDKQSQLQKLAAGKEKELGEIAEMMQSALEL